ncbi:unnamed protein product (macronuclear) [Paramecium tetraurelia]|uniref:Cullin family profile domain-containing protein n=1 Tax=Paramecium tetraurelia TaxID=5888 RepID=A0CE82_PARTE|nr:uncharacterized protein GSPATT00037535001 [Paramecium tetraurelia]CAK69099.1 unnamed protein product [Paramecium tetraurelia]|eukprot:XP_001436496.1 hypothetical protein (macronuclear) [Paramecium tetraurelia strain d4-2]
MEQSQNLTKKQFQELEKKIQISFNNIFKANTVRSKEHSKSDIQLNGEMMNFILKFHNDEQIEMAINFFRLLTKNLKNHIYDYIIPSLGCLKFDDQRKGCQNLEVFIKIYENYIQRSKYLLTSFYFAINLLHQNNLLETLQNYLSYLLFERLSSTHIPKSLYCCFFQQLDVAYTQVDHSQDSWKNLTLVLNKFGDILINLQQGQPNIEIILDFPDQILSHFKNKYQGLFNSWIDQCEIPLYLRRVKREKELNDQILNFQSNSIKQKVNSLLEDHLLKNYKDVILSEKKPFNLGYLLQNFQYEAQQYQNDLELFNELYLTHDPDDQEIKMKIKQKIIQEGNQILEMIINEEINQKLAHRFIISLFQLFQKYLKMIEICLCHNTNISSLLTSAFEELLNCQNQNIDFQEYFVLYIEVEIENVINSQINKEQLIDSIQLLLFISENQDFTLYYQSRLAQRLLKYYRILTNHESFQIYLRTESLIIQKMSSLMGNQNIYPLQLMIEEFQKNSDTTFEFRTENHKLLIAQYPLLLRYQDWPKFQQQQIELNQELQTVNQLKLQFEQQQDQKFINWLDLISYVDIECSKLQITFRISIPQAIILFSYQFQNELMSIKRISQITKLQEYFILQNCAEMKDAKILEEVIQDDVKLYRFNEELKDQEVTQMRKLVIATAQIPFLYLKKSKQRKNLYSPIEAFIIRTLKNQKKILFQDLVPIIENFIKHTFNERVQSDQITSIVQDLYEKGYLEKDETNPELLKYV